MHNIHNICISETFMIDWKNKMHVKGSCGINSNIGTNKPERDALSACKILHLLPHHINASVIRCIQFQNHVLVVRSIELAGNSKNSWCFACAWWTIQQQMWQPILSCQPVNFCAQKSNKNIYPNTTFFSSSKEKHKNISPTSCITSCIVKKVEAASSSSFFCCCLEEKNTPGQRITLWGGLQTKQTYLCQ